MSVGNRDTSNASSANNNNNNNSTNNNSVTKTNGSNENSSNGNNNNNVTSATNGSNCTAGNNGTTIGGMPTSTAANRLGGEEEWKNIHTMLNCISAMVDKTKRAITILQQRGTETTNQTHSNYSFADASIAEIKRHTEEKVAEFRRNAEEAVNQVKRQAVIEIQRAVAAAENRAVEVIAKERIKFERIFAGKESNKKSKNKNMFRK